MFVECSNQQRLLNKQVVIVFETVQKQSFVDEYVSVVAHKLNGEVLKPMVKKGLEYVVFILLIDLLLLLPLLAPFEEVFEIQHPVANICNYLFRVRHPVPIFAVQVNNNME